MKYPIDKYIDSQIFSMDLDGSESNFSEKVVKIRKPHNCCVCDKVVDKGHQMVKQNCILADVGWSTCYICLPCIENWLEESGQVTDADLL